jgi:hypothetical protein
MTGMRNQLLTLLLTFAVPAARAADSTCAKGTACGAAYDAYFSLVCGENADLAKCRAAFDPLYGGYVERFSHVCAGADPAPAPREAKGVCRVAASKDTYVPDREQWAKWPNKDYAGELEFYSKRVKTFKDRYNRAHLLYKSLAAGALSAAQLKDELARRTDQMAAAGDEDLHFRAVSVIYIYLGDRAVKHLALEKLAVLEKIEKGEKVAQSELDRVFSKEAQADLQRGAGLKASLARAGRLAESRYRVLASGLAPIDSIGDPAVLARARGAAANPYDLAALNEKERARAKDLAKKLAPKAAPPAPAKKEPLPPSVAAFEVFGDDLSGTDRSGLYEPRSVKLLKAYDELMRLGANDASSRARLAAVEAELLRRIEVHNGKGTPFPWKFATRFMREKGIERQAPPPPLPPLPDIVKPAEVKLGRRVLKVGAPFGHKGQDAHLLVASIRAREPEGYAVVTGDKFKDGVTYLLVLARDGSVLRQTKFVYDQGSLISVEWYKGEDGFERKLSIHTDRPSAGQYGTWHGWTR